MNLSPRGREIVSDIAEGLTNKEIAARRGLKESTVKWHVSRMLRRTGLPNRAALVRLLTPKEPPR